MREEGIDRSMKASLDQPKIVRWVFEALSSRMGRQGQVRVQKNGEHWFVNDPIFAFLQIGLRSGITDYRAGFMIKTAPLAIYFAMFHTPSIAKVFRANVTAGTILGVLDQTTEYRRNHRLFYSSKHEARRGGKWAVFEDSCYPTFRDLLVKRNQEMDLVRDLFPVLSNQGKGLGKARKAGHDFVLLLADKASALSRKSDVQKLVDDAWPIFKCMYPVKSPQRRAAILASKLRTARIERQCEFLQIKNINAIGADAACSGQLEGAHIRPDALGGSDEADNGLWLCRHHHRSTEGLLRGRRGSVRAIRI